MTALSSSGANNQLFLVTFQGTLAGLPQPLMTINTTSLTASANIALGSVSTATTGTPALTINTGATVTLDNSAVNVANRINNSATAWLAFNGGTLNVVGGAGVSTTQQFGAVAATTPSVLFLSGSSTIQTTAGSGGSVALIANSVNRSAGATANLAAGSGQTLGSAANQIIINVPSSAVLTNNIIKGFTVTDAAGGGFNLATATGSSTSTISALPTASYATLSTTGGNTSADNVLVTAATGPIASDTVNAILIQGDNVAITGSAARS